MDTQHARTNRLSAQNICTSCLLVGTLAAWMGFAQSASAALIVNSVRYDGQVRSAGGVQGEELHFTNNDFPPLTAPMHLVPAVAPDPPAPLAATKDLMVFAFTQLPSVNLNGQFYPRSELWLTAATGGNLFANPLDTTLSVPPVELELEVYDPNLPALEKLIFEYIGVVGTLETDPTTAPATVMTSGRGSQDDPLLVTLGLNANQVNLSGVRGQVKVQFYLDTMVIPEPASAALAGLGCLGLVGVALRRRGK